MADYVITRELPDTDHDTALRRVRELLADEGFGVITEVDVRATLRAKLDVDFRPYVILGACNPALAHRALSVEPMVGALLPCNVVVAARDGGGSLVAAFSPVAGFRMVANPDLQPLAAEVEERLVRTLDRLVSD